METLYVLLALCEENPSLTGGFHSQSSATRRFEVFVDLWSGWANNGDAGVSRRHCAYYDFNVMTMHYIFYFPEIYMGWHPIVNDLPIRRLLSANGLMIYKVLKI